MQNSILTVGFLRISQRFFRYLCVGGSTFLFDLAFLFTLVNRLHVDYLLATGTSFFIALSVNYAISRRYVFSGSTRTLHFGYAYFLIIALSGLGIVEMAMYFLVGLWHWNYLFARIVIGAFAGLWNYFLNLHMNFRVAGQPLDSVHQKSR
jgi:putative flippase GtrA